METQALRLLIRQKVSDGRLPSGGVAKVWGTRGDGQHCHGCDEVVTKTEFIMEGPVLNDGRRARDVQFHVLCFHVWDDERHGSQDGQIPSTRLNTLSGATAYRDHRILTTTAKQHGGGWGVTVTVYDPDGALAMEPSDLGGGITFDTKAIADSAGVLFARAWIDRRG